MTVPSHFHMPGAFQAEGVHPGLFRPPISPSSSASYGYAPRAAASVDSHTKRKRHRHEISRSQEMPADEDMEGNDFFTTPATHTRHQDRHYHLAGQLGTPNGGPVESNFMDESLYSDSDYRRALGSKRTCDEIDRNMDGPTAFFNLHPPPVPSQGWGSLAVSALGGVVGKVWEFCKAGAFRGFQAGGGRAFRVTAEGVREIHSLDEKFSDDQHMPGRFPQMEPQLEPVEERIDSRASTPTGPATKRRHTNHRDDLGRNWVIVGDSDPNVPTKTPQRRSQRPTPRSRNSGPSMTTGRRISTPASRLASTPTPTPSHRRPASRASSRLSHAPSPSLPSGRSSSRLSHAPSSSLPSGRPASTVSTASFASFRSPSPTKIPQPAPSRRRNSVAPSPSPVVHGHRRSHSNASTASNRGGADASPRLTAEAKHLAARRKMEERDADVRIAAFNKQLQDMIRQGKEALGTTIEVEGTWEDD
ncbi:hypothetical protein QQX98_003601 [Neonectria punicea]|uniref:Uncharacterized protein n=1 Tax=Neonectria punicea TaxID=979145 RepID=A0ABR1HCK6_9HYPO